MKNPNRPVSTMLFGLRIGLCLAWGLPCILVAIILLATIVFIPVGIALLPIAVAPAVHVINRRLKDRMAYDNRDKPLFEDDEREKPWETN